MVFMLTGNFAVAKQMPGNMGFRQLLLAKVRLSPFSIWPTRADESTTRHALVYLIGRQHQQSSGAWQAKQTKPFFR
jgi:hypothetical protein